MGVDVNVDVLDGDDEVALDYDEVAREGVVDEVVDEIDVVDAESADELGGDELELDEEPDDEFDGPESGSAHAMPGMVATAIPSATAEAPTRTIALRYPSLRSSVC